MTILVAGIATVFGVSTLVFLFLMWRAPMMNEDEPIRSDGPSPRIR